MTWLSWIGGTPAKIAIRCAMSIGVFFLTSPLLRDGVPETTSNLLILFIFRFYLFGRSETQHGGPCGHRSGSASHKQPNKGGSKGQLGSGTVVPTPNPVAGPIPATLEASIEVRDSATLPPIRAHQKQQPSIPFFERKSFLNQSQKKSLNATVKDWLSGHGPPLLS